MKTIIKQYYFGEIVSKYLYERFRRNLTLPLLDVGAGGGDFIKFLFSKYPNRKDEIQGLDLVLKPELNITKGNINKIPFKDNSFQTVICSEVLEHLDDATLLRGLQEIHRVLKKDGKVLFTVPFKEDLSKSMVICPHCKKVFHRVGHVRSFESKEQIKNLIEKYGLLVQLVDILPLGAVATVPILRYAKCLLNRFDNPPGFKKRAIILAKKHES